MSSMNPFMKLTKADFTLIDPQLRTGKGVKFNDVAGLRVSCHVFVKTYFDKKLGRLWLEVVVGITKGQVHQHHWVETSKVEVGQSLTWVGRMTMLTSHKLTH